MFFLKINFQDKTKLHAICLFYSLNIYRNCLPSQFLSPCIRMHIAILIFSLKLYFLQLNFQDEGHLYVNCLFYILTTNFFLNLNIQDGDQLYANCWFYFELFTVTLWLLFSVLKWQHTYAHFHPDRDSKQTHQQLKKRSYFS